MRFKEIPYPPNIKRTIEIDGKKLHSKGHRAFSVKCNNSGVFFSVMHAIEPTETGMKWHCSIAKSTYGIPKQVTNNDIKQLRSLLPLKWPDEKDCELMPLLVGNFAGVGVNVWEK